MSLDCPVMKRKCSYSYHFLKCRCATCRTYKSHEQRVSTLRKYGLTFQQYSEMLEAQNGVCAICQRPERYNNHNGPLSLAVDHDHETGKVRGLLCKMCNQALGHLGDNAESIERVKEYLSA